MGVDEQPLPPAVQEGIRWFEELHEQPQCFLFLAL